MLKLLNLLSRVLSRVSHAIALTVVLFFAMGQAQAGTVSNLFNLDLHNTAAGVVQGKGATYQGYVYGTTADVTRTSGGTIFRVPTSGGPPEVIYQFTTSDGYSPRATLLMSDDGYLYGTTHNSAPVSNKLRSGGGTVFRIKPDGSDFQTIYDFGGATNNPNVDDSVFADFALVDDTAKLYGVAKLGGANRTGQVFSIDKTAFQHLPLHDFPAGTLNTAGGYEPTSEEGLLPSASLTVGSDSKLYGVTASGGDKAITSTGSVTGTGTIFSLGKDGSGFQTLVPFDALNTIAPPARNATGVTPAGALIELPQFPGKFVGTATSGGAPATSTVAGYGTVFLLDATVTPATITAWYSFDNTNGASPSGALVVKDHVLYGVTTAGSANSIGNIFALTYSATDINALPAFSVEHAFAGAEGIRVNDGLSLSSTTDGDLYAATAQGGACTSYTAAGYGAVLRYSFAGTVYAPYSNCTTISRSGGGAFQMPWLWLLGVLGLVPLMRRWLVVHRG